MSAHASDPASRMMARIAGFAYLALFFLAMFANFFVIERLIEPEDAGATFRNIADSELLFRGGAVAFLIIAILDIIIAWALYDLFRPAGRSLALLAAWFRLAYSVLLVVAVVFLFISGRITSGAGFWHGVDQPRVITQLSLALNGFSDAWTVGLALFGIHLILIGALVLRSRIAPKLLGPLLIAAGAAYLLDTLAQGLLPSYDDYASIFLVIVAVPSIIGELAFTWWLLARGGGHAAAEGAKILQPSEA